VSVKKSPSPPSRPATPEITCDSAQENEGFSFNEGTKTYEVKNLQEDRWGSAAFTQSRSIEGDLELRCSDGIVLADQCVLGAASSMIRKICDEQSTLLVQGSTGDRPDRRKQDLVSISLPDVESDVMATVLSCFYHGFIKIEGSGTDQQGVEKIKKIKSCWKILDISAVTLKSLELVKTAKAAQETRVHVIKSEDKSVKQEPEKLVKQEPVSCETPPPARSRPVRKASANTSYAEDDQEDDPDDPDELPDLDAPAYTPNSSSNSAAGKRKAVLEPPIMGLKKVAKVENGRQAYSAQAIHCCVICKGKTPDGRLDKEASNLTFENLRKLKEHYAKCLYTEGKVVKHVDPEPFNVDGDGKVIDEYGRSYKYMCSVKGCWKQKKEVGYKELAMHNTVEHGVMELILAEETDPTLVRLLDTINECESRELAETRPLHCRVAACSDRDVSFPNKNDYKDLKGHYATVHYRAWFVAREDGGRQRTQKVVEPGMGTICRLCKDRVYGNEDLMMGHYAAKHERLQDAVMDQSCQIDPKEARNILMDLFPDKVANFDWKNKNKK